MGDYKPIMAEGKRSFMAAALRLSRTSRSISAIGIRELAREAGLNPNTFYKHFDNMSDLGLTLIATLDESLRQPMRRLRQQAAGVAMAEVKEMVLISDFLALAVRRAERVNSETVRLLFDFVEQNPDAISLVMRELHGASPAMRAALRAFVAASTADMAEDLRNLQLVPLLEDKRIDGIAALISQQMLALALDYLEQPDQRAAIREQAQVYIRTLMIGTLAQQEIDTAVMMMLLDLYRKLPITACPGSSPPAALGGGHHPGAA
ncbi:MAG: TetR family transcriptional regulator [Pseudomonadota bacterium]